MAKMLPIEYKSRDGLLIRGYLTVPLGSSGTKLPLIVVPHGGPAVRDRWEFDPMVQFLANRGYAVLQMNFRGSAGYGLKFLEAGFVRQPQYWGGFRKDYEHWIQRRVGNLRMDKMRLKAISPVNLAEKIQAPILLAYGEADPIVNIEQARSMAKALKKKKKKFELIIEKNEAHGFTTKPL
jgi:dipeptidyl aminopeptidase/acylaminoacyl peptidase